MHLFPVSVLLGSISLCSLTVVAFDAAVMTPAPQNPAKSTGQNPSKGPEVPPYTGQVGDWWIAAPGQVQFQILGSAGDVKDGKQLDLWFKTPADKDVSTQFEELVLDVLLHAASKGLHVIVEAKTSSGDDGSVAAKGFDIVRVGLGRS